MAYSLFTASYGLSSANFRVRILETNNGTPAIITLKDGTVVNSEGEAVVDAYGNLSVYLDNTKTFGVHINQYLLSHTDSNVALLVKRTAFQLSSAPTAADLELGPGALFYDETNPVAYYHISANKTSFMALTGSGTAGSDGLNNATIYLYQRANSEPPLPNLPVIYTFATSSAVGLSNGWQPTISAGSAPIYVTLATAAAGGLTDTIAPNEWASPVIFSQNGINSASVFLFQRTTTSTPPSVPDQAVTYTFATGVASGLNNGWSQSLPTSGGAYRWMTDASALATSGVPTDTINPSEWAAVALLAQDGTDGSVGLNNAIVYAYQRAASAPTVPGATVTYTFATGITVGLDNGWTSTVPSGSLPIYITIATAASANPSDTITSAEWATPILFAQNGTAGLNTASVFLYQVTSSSSAPPLPSAAVTYTFSSAVATGVNNGWVQSLPTSGGAYRWITTGSALSTTSTDVILPAEWAPAALLSADGNPGSTGLTGPTGPGGQNGLNNAVVLVYQRAVSSPAVPSATVTYTFATGGITGLTNGWLAAIPAGTDPIYVTSATASNSGTTDTIATGEWATPVVLAQNGTAGLNAATVYLFQRTSSSVAPSVPSATVTYTFATGVLTGLTNGWSQSLVPVGGAYRWTTTATALGTGTTDTIATGEWAAVSLLAQDGSVGAGTYTFTGNANVTISGAVVTKTAGGNSYNGQAYSQQAYSNGAQMSMIVAGTDNIVAGLNTDPTTSGGSGYAGIDYAVTVTSNVMQIFESGTLRGSFGAVANGDILGVRYDNANVYYTLNGTTIRTLVVSAGQKLYLDTAFGVLNASTGFTFSAAGAIGANGSNGTNGTNGLRGSQTYYATLGGSTATYSDSLATTTASAGGGPILNDVVVQSNSSVGFSQTKFWNGSSWVILTQVLDGNLLVTGTVGAAAISAGAINATKIAAGAITASKLIISDFENLVFNPKGNSAEGWTGNPVAPAAIIAGFWPSGSASGYALGFQARDNFYGVPFAVLPTDSFYLAMDTIPYGGGASTYTFNIGLVFLDLNGAIIAFNSAAGRSIGSSGFVSVAAAMGTPAGAAYAQPWVQINGPSGTNFTANGQGHYATNVQVRRQNGGNLIVDGSISANKIVANTITANQISATAGITAGQIDARGLSIKDSSGNVILSAGVPLASANVTPDAGWLNSNVTVSGRNIITLARMISNGGVQTTDYYGNQNAVNITLAPGGNYRVTPFTMHDIGNYSFSFWVKANVSVNVEVDICDNVNHTYAVTTAWQSFKVEGEYNASTYLNNTYFGFIDFNNTSGSTVVITISNLMVEYSNKASIWSPAPEDVASGIALAATTANWTTVTGTGKPSDNATTDLKLIARNSCILTGNTGSKPSGASAWDSDIYSLDSFTGGAYAAGVVASAVGPTTLMFGLNSDPTTDSNYTSLDYAWYFDTGGNCNVYESGTYVVGLGSWVAGDIFAVAYDGVGVSYIHNGAIARTSGVTAGLKFFFDSSFSNPGSILSNIRFGPLTSVAAVTTAASNAQGTANTAVTNASTAQGTANTAVTNAGNAQSTANTAVTNAAAAQSAANAAATAAADRLSKSAASILSATVSINAVTGAGFVAGNLTWDSAGVRTGGSGVAMTPGGLLGANSAGATTFSINASTGNAFFAGTLQSGVASKGAASSSMNANVSVPTGTVITSITTGNISAMTYTVGAGDLLLTCNLNVYLGGHTSTPYVTFIDIMDGTSTSLFNPTNNPQPAIIHGLVNTAYGGAIQPWLSSDTIGIALLIPGGTLSAGSHTFYYKVTSNFVDGSGNPNNISGGQLTTGGQMKIREFVA